jgi:Ca2+-binding EF-hand superfamily protein
VEKWFKSWGRRRLLSHANKNDAAVQQEYSSVRAKLAAEAKIEKALEASNSHDSQAWAKTMNESSSRVRDDLLSELTKDEKHLEYADQFKDSFDEFKAADEDGDNFISETEWQLAISQTEHKLRPAKVKELFVDADSSKDGRIDLAEFKVFMDMVEHVQAELTSRAADPTNKTSQADALTTLLNMRDESADTVGWNCG